MIGYTDNAFDGYPGFIGATPAPLAPGSSELIDLPYEKRQIRESSGASEYQDGDLRIVGNEDLHVLRTEPIPSGFRAFVCDSTLNVYKQAAGATQFAPLKLQAQVLPTDADNMKVWRIEFSDRDPRVDPNQPDASKPQQGPLPAPLTDVFGNWFVTGRESVAGWSNAGGPGLIPNSPEDRQLTRDSLNAENEMRQQCFARYPLSADERAKRANTVLASPPPVDPAVPGWPEAGS